MSREPHRGSVRVQLLGRPAEVMAMADAIRAVAEVHGQSSQRKAERSPGCVVVHLKATLPPQGPAGDGDS